MSRWIASRMPFAVAGSPRRRQLAWFALWLPSTVLCGSAGGIGAARFAGASIAEWPAGALAVASLVQLVATTELLLALFDEDLSAARLRRAIRLAPIAGTVAAAAAMLLLRAFTGSTLPFGALATACGLGVVLLAIVSADRRARPTRIARLAIYLVAWAAYAAAAMAEALFALARQPAPEWLSSGNGAVVFTLCATALLAGTLRADARRRERTQRNLLDSARQYRHVYYSAPVALMSADPFGQILRWNDLCALFLRNELRQGRVNTLGTVFGSERAATLIRDTTATGRHRCELQLALGDGDGDGVRTCAVDALLAANAIEISLVDVTERTVLARTLEHMAYHDPLTDRMNLRGLERELAQVSRSVTLGAVASLLYIDLKWFKAINELFGHAAGNSVVVELSDRLQQVLPQAACVGRLGGDEFLVVLPDCGVERARELALRSTACITDDPFEIDGKRIRVDASVGVVEVAPDMSVVELIAYASAACAEARKSGVGVVGAVESSREHLARYRAEVDLGLRLRTSLPVERMSVFAQPIVPLRQATGGRPAMCYEVLLRERDEEGKIQSPARLIAAAERHGAMCAIDRFMLERTLQHLSGNAPHAAAIDFMTVNLSGISLNDERFLADAHSLLGQYGEVAQKICLEITESVAMYDLKCTRRFVERMRSLGVRIALDDFGAGHSSFAYLRELPASLIKIDGQFMLEIDRHPRNQVIVSGIRRLTEELGVACLAEWIEDVAALEFLLRLEMDYAQGFVLARPKPIENWLTEAVDLSALDEARRRVPHGSGRTTSVAHGREASRTRADAVERQSGQAVPT